MILGNKCDMEDKRQVSRERGEAVSSQSLLFFFTRDSRKSRQKMVKKHSTVL